MLSPIGRQGRVTRSVSTPTCVSRRERYRHPTRLTHELCTGGHAQKNTKADTHICHTTYGSRGLTHCSLVLRAVCGVCCGQNTITIFMCVRYFLGHGNVFKSPCHSRTRGTQGGCAAAATLACLQGAVCVWGVCGATEHATIFTCLFWDT